jgi:CheY-like chemotaxis protein
MVGACCDAPAGPAGRDPGAAAETSALILIAEDNPVNQRVAARLVARLGYAADVVSTGAEAILAVAEHSYAAVLMDCQMPDLDGYDAARAIRAWEAEPAASGTRRRLPIIAFTALTTAADRERCANAGMDDFLAKPVNLEDLALVLARWVRR